MVDVSNDELLGLAKVAGMSIPEEDVSTLTMRFNAVREALEELDHYPIGDVLALPTLPHPSALPEQGRGPEANLSLPTDTDAPLAYKPIIELAHLIQTRQVSPVELTDLYLERIGRYDSELKSYITVVPEIAKQEALEAERALNAGGDFGQLHGIPLAYKDEFYTKGLRTTCGSRILNEFVPDYDATAVTKLHQAGAVMLGKLNMTEWATPLTLEFAYGQPRNPWSLEHDAGGSSTGSGIATAAGLAAGTLGEDTGGSIRRPASFNSCVGIRPSWGRVSMHGVIPSVWSQDTAGPLTRTVADAALLLKAIAGYDVNDPITANLPVPDYLTYLNGDISGMRIGVIKETMEASHLNPEVKAAVQEAIRQFTSLGAAVEEVSIPTVALGSVVNGVSGSDRTALQWKNLMEAPHQYDIAARRFNLLPGLFPAVLHQRALQLRSLLRRDILDACARFDVIITPYQATPPPLIEDTKKPLASKEQALEEIKKFSFSTMAPIAGIPALCLPCGFTEDGLPIGLQVMADRFDETSVFRAAHAYEVSTKWHTMRPPVGD